MITGQKLQRMVVEDCFNETFTGISGREKMWVHELLRVALFVKNLILLVDDS